MNTILKRIRRKPLAQHPREVFWAIDQQFRNHHSCIQCQYLATYFSKHVHSEWSEVLAVYQIDPTAIAEAANRLIGKQAFAAEDNLIYVTAQIDGLLGYLTQAVGEILRTR